MINRWMATLRERFNNNNNNEDDDGDGRDDDDDDNDWNSYHIL